MNRFHTEESLKKFAEKLKAFRDIVIYIGAKLHEKLVKDKSKEDAERLADFLDMM